MSRRDDVAASVHTDSTDLHKCGDSGSAQKGHGPVTMALADRFEAHGQYELAEIARMYAVDRPRDRTVRKFGLVFLFVLAALVLACGIATLVAYPRSNGVGFAVMLVVASALVGAGIGVWRAR